MPRGHGSRMLAKPEGPDLSVVGGELLGASDDRASITNLIPLVEVLFESTERSDRGKKFARDRRPDSFDVSRVVLSEARASSRTIHL